LKRLRSLSLNQDRTRTVSKLTEELGIIEAGINVLQDIDSNKQ
jgi:hypothetical protein